MRRCACSHRGSRACAQADEEAAEQQRRREQRAQLDEHYAARERERAVNQQLDELRRLNELREAAARAAENAKRVAFRSQQLADKQAQRVRSEQERARHAAEVQAKLEALAAQVRVEAEAYAALVRERARRVTDTCAHARMHRDPQRVLQPTESSKAADAAAASAALFRVHGYSEKQLMADERYRLASALHAAGLAQSSLAADALARAQPARAPRIDMFDHGQLQSLHAQQQARIEVARATLSSLAPRPAAPAAGPSSLGNG